jgi:chaperonin GroEL (HSP60 family)
MDSLYEPLRQIADNAGYDAEEIAEKQKSQKEASASMLRKANGSI